MKLSGKVAIVSGAASGIGRASVLTFAREGARVTAVDIDATGGAETLAQLESQGAKLSLSLPISATKLR